MIEERNEMGDYDYMLKHFGEVDDYMVAVINRAEAMGDDPVQAEALVAEVRADGYPKLADKLAELAKQ